MKKRTDGSTVLANSAPPPSTPSTVVLFKPTDESLSPLLSAGVQQQHKQQHQHHQQPSASSDNERQLASAANQDTFAYKEGGFGWVVVVATGYCCGILFGMVNNYALIYNEFDRVYNGTIDNHIVYSAWIGSVSTGVQYIFCAFGSVLCDLFGARRIGLAGGLVSTLSIAASAFVGDMRVYLLTYGVGFGVGQALLLAATLAILPHYFNKRLGLANGLMNFIAAVIVTLLPIATDKTIELFSLKGTFYFLALLNLTTVLMAFSYRPRLPPRAHVTSAPQSSSSPSQSPLNRHHECDDQQQQQSTLSPAATKSNRHVARLKSSLGLSIFEKPKFLIWCVGSLIGSFGYLIPIINIDHHVMKAFPFEQPFIINIVFGAASGVSAIVFGKLGDLARFNRVHFHTFAYLAYGLVQITIPHAANFHVLLGQMLLLGLVDGVLLCLIVPISLDVAKSSALANQAAGYYHVALSPTIIAGPAIAGQIYELYGSYDWAFYFGGAACLVGALILFVFIAAVDVTKQGTRRREAAANPIPHKSTS